MSDVNDQQPPSGETKPRNLTQRVQAMWQGLLGLSAGADPTLRESLEEALEGHDGEGRTLTPEERHMLANILSFGELRVDDVMVPRADVIALEENETLTELLRVYAECNHSRMPIYRETLDDPIGMFHIKDVVEYLTPPNGDEPKPTKPFSLKAIRRDVLFVPPSMPALDLLVKMQATHIHLALVIDEYGGTDGLASLEDIVEMVVGDIEDEHDDDEPMITQAGDGVFIVDGKAEIEDVARMIGSEFTAGEHGESVDTIGGMIFNTLGRVPARGEVVQAIPGFEFHVLDADPRRVKRVRIVHSLKAERRRRAARAEQA